MNSLSPSMCLTALAPATTSPSIAVVTKIRLPQTIGEECPRPGIATFHLILLTVFQLVGRFFSSETPCPDGPLHCGQLGPEAPALFVTISASIERQPTAIKVRTKIFIFVSFNRES